MCLIAAGDSAPNGPLDAATLDIIASGLWGRAESVRTLIRGVFESFARLAFGIVSMTLAGASAGDGEPASTRITWPLPSVRPSPCAIPS
jgi:hypothetical protein